MGVLFRIDEHEGALFWNNYDYLTHYANDAYDTCLKTMEAIWLKWHAMNGQKIFQTIYFCNLLLHIFWFNVLTVYMNAIKIRLWSYAQSVRCSWPQIQERTFNVLRKGWAQIHFKNAYSLWNSPVWDIQERLILLSNTVFDYCSLHLWATNWKKCFVTLRQKICWNNAWAMKKFKNV